MPQAAFEQALRRRPREGPAPGRHAGAADRALAPFRGTTQLPDEVYEAWVKIDSGEPALVSEGNQALLEHEQKKILPPSYRELTSTPPGAVFAEFLTLTTESITPGGRPYAEVMVSDNHLGPILLPDLEIPVYRTLFPGHLGRVRGHIADTRWEWIERDMWPSFDRFVSQQRDLLDQMMQTPVADLAEERRKSPLPFRR